MPTERNTRDSAPKGRSMRRCVALAALVALGGACFTAQRALRAGPTSTSRAAGGANPSWAERWTPGTEYTFAFSWSGDTRATIAPGGGAGIDVAVDLAGDLVARAGVQDGRTVLELRLENLARHGMRALGVDAVPTDEAARSTLEEPRAWADLDARGAVARLRFTPDAPRPFREAMTKLVEQMHVTPSGDARSDWTAREPGPNGRALASYHADGLSLTRTRTRYESLSALSDKGCTGCQQQLVDRGAITLDRRGIVGSIDDDESLRIAQGAAEALRSANRFSLRLVRVAPFHGGIEVPAVATEERTPGTRAPVTAGDEQAILRSEAAGFTEEQLDYAIDLFATKGQRVPDKTWLVHARAYLLLHPEALEALGRRVTAPGVDPRGRNMMMQVLAVTGSPRAQALMTAALDALEGTESERDYAHLVQKLGIVGRPTADTTDYVQDAYRSACSRGDRRMALSDAAALGGIASRLAKGGDDTGARSIVVELESDLRAAEAPEDKRGLVVALRNAGAAGDDTVRALASDESADVRSEVARALGDDDSPASRATLVSLASSDSEVVVASSALQSLGRDAASADDVRAIAAAVLSGRTSPALDGTVMDFFAGHLDSPDAGRVLAFILARTKDPALARRVRALLEQMAT